MVSFPFNSFSFQLIFHIYILCYYCTSIHLSSRSSMTFNNSNVWNYTYISKACIHKLTKVWDHCHSSFLSSSEGRMCPFDRAFLQNNKSGSWGIIIRNHVGEFLAAAAALFSTYLALSMLKQLLAWKARSWLLTSAWTRWLSKLTYRTWHWH
jgi:hypothetical protein